MKLILVLFNLLLLLPFYSKAQEDHSLKPKHHEDHYHLSAFAGFTTNYKGKQGYKLGIEYEWRFKDWMGLGGTFDFTGNDFNIFAFSVGATFYPFKIPLVTAVGVGLKNYDKSSWKDFYRAMVAYDFHLGKISLSPLIMYDLFPNRKDIMSYGVAVGFSLH